MSRKFLVPLVLPADPTAPMEAATKQYVDGLAGGGSEVEISTTDPISTNPAAELWYDSDEAASSLLASQIAFTPAGSIAATNVQSAIAEFNTEAPRGIVASVNGQAQISCPAGALTYLTTAIAITLQVGRMYRLAWTFRAVGRQDSSDSPVAYKIALYDGTTELPGGTWMDHWFLFRGQWNTMAGFILKSGDGAARSLRIGIGSPPTALYIFPTWFTIEDMGVG